MRFFILFIVCAIGAFAFESVYKYAFNDEELSSAAAKTREALKAHNAHLGTIEKSDIFEGEGGLAALKTGYIELLAANAQTLQHLVPAVWRKLEASKKGDDLALKEELEKFGFTLIKVRFFKNKTIVILANSSVFAKMPSATQKILIDSL
ncbi:MAG: hypothetical protein LBQ52_05310 [Helicobacteraceae bacterium]|jgi:hypothetical protein|nr:hypothetical protein [Helicobacteraceae bacterium]